MKTMTFAVAASVVLVWLPATVATAAIKNWNALSGNWNTAGNWSPAGVPGAGDDVNIKPTDGVSRTITYDYPGPPITLNSLGVNLNGGTGSATTTLSMAANNLSVGELDVGWSGFSGSNGNGTFTQSGGQTNVTGPGLYVSVNATDKGTYNLSGAGTLTVSAPQFIGVSGAGFFNQSGGTYTAATHILHLGFNAGSTGTYTLSGGSLAVNANHVYVGASGTGIFNQSGGTNTFSPSAGSLVLGNGAGSTGTYNLSGGALNLNSAGNEFVGFDGTGTFIHSGGSNTFNNGGTSLVIGHNAASLGAYVLSGTGSLLVRNDEYVGDSATGNVNQSGGTFNHSGGSNTVQDDLIVGHNAGSTGTYALSGAGLLSVIDDMLVGNSGTGNVNQTGGTSIVGGFLDLASQVGSTGTYTLSGGSISAVDTTIGVSGAGTFNQTGGALSSTNSLWVGLNAGSTGTYSISGGSATSTSVSVINNTSAINVSGNGVLNAFSLASGGSSSSINLSGGTINASEIDFGGMPSRLNWTSGKLNITSNVTWDSAAISSSTSTAFGSSRTLGSNQSLMVTGNETIGGGGSFHLTLNSGSAHHVTGDLTLNPTGTITQNADSSLYAATFVQAGGTVNGTLQNQGTFIHQNGLFTGRLLNQGAASISGPSFVTGNGVANEGSMTVAAGQTLTVNGAGLDNLGTFTLAGGAIAGSGPVVNNFGGTLTARGTINPAFTNNGVLDVDGVLRLNGASATNNGIVRGSGTVIGVFMNAPGGTLDLAADDLLAISNAWTNSGLVTLTGGAVLGGGTISNSGTIQGAGTVNSPIANTGVIRASGGELDLGAAGNTNAAAGLIQASTGNTVMFLQGLATNSGTIGLSGGAFDNNNRSLSNPGIINGFGTIRTSGLTNANNLNVGEGNMDVFGSVTNNGTIGVQGGRSIYFFSPVSGPGSFTGAGTAVFLAAVSPGSSPAAVSFAGDATLTSTSMLNIELGGITPGSQYDQLLVTGALTLGGALDISLINGFTPSAGQAFNILDWGSLAGTFSSINLPILTGLAWNTSQLYTTGVLSVASPFLEADFNENGAVNGADLTIWKTGFGAPGGAAHTQGDANADGDVDGADFLVWQRQLGSGAVLPATDAVPEPATMVSLSLGLLLACRTAKRRRLVGAGKPVSAMRAARCVAQFATIGVVCAAGGSSAHGLNVTVDYSFDLLSQGGSGFFESTPTAVAAMNAAAADISAAIGPSLAGIPTDIFTGMSGAGSATINCTMTMRNPCTGIATSMDVFTPIAADAFTVFAGMRAQSPSTAFAEVATGSFTRTLSGPSADQVAAFNVAKDAANATIRREGGGGVGPVNNSQPTFVGDPPFPSLTFGPLAASVSFDNDVDNNNVPDNPATRDAFWHYEHDQPVAAGQIDFYTVSLHEILHSLGFGIRQFGSGGTTWNQMRSGTTWNGSRVIALNGGSGVNMVSFSEDHIGDPDGGLNGYMSTRITDGAPQEVVMDFNTDPGARKFLTHMDLAFMEDIGYALTPSHAAGDFDEDGDVDGDDRTIWSGGFGTGATHVQGDANGDGDVDGGDFLVWQRQVGSPEGAVSSSTTASGAVPEPATIAPGLVALAGFHMRKRPSHQRTTATVY